MGERRGAVLGGDCIGNKLPHTEIRRKYYRDKNIYCSGGIIKEKDKRLNY